MHEIEIITEEEASTGWRFDVRLFADGRTYDFKVRLGWSDYDLWSHGRVGPSRVVETAFEFLLNNEAPTAIMSSFDCGVIRRYFPHVDAELPKMI